MTNDLDAKMCYLLGQRVDALSGNTITHDDLDIWCATEAQQVYDADDAVAQVAIVMDALTERYQHEARIFGAEYPLAFDRTLLRAILAEVAAPYTERHNALRDEALHIIEQELGCPPTTPDL